MHGIIENLIIELTRPGSAENQWRLVIFHAERRRAFATEAIQNAKAGPFLQPAFQHHERDIEICSDDSRDKSRLVVVEEPSNILVIERVKSFHCLYHVLLGALSPIDGITPERLKIGELVSRVKSNGIQEVIIATNPNTKGEITAQYIKEVLSPLSVTVSRIAYGLPMGSDIEFADEVTLGKALEGRRQI
jgi:recombination protein RecR